MKTEASYTRADILGVFAIWFIYGLVTLPSIGELYARGLAKVLDIIGIEQRHISQLPKEFVYNTLASKLQYNLPAQKEDQKDKHYKIDLLYLICLLLKLMEENFPLAWVPPINLTVDESLWAFKGITFLERFMPEKPQKYGFLEYALCTMNGYFLCILVHHIPGQAKRDSRGLTEDNLDANSVLQLKLQKQYGSQGAIVMQLVSMLEYHGHHIIGDNAFSSVQLVVDLEQGNDHDLLWIPKCDYTGTQNMQVKKKKEGAQPLELLRYSNLPEQ